MSNLKQNEAGKITVVDTAGATFTLRILDLDGNSILTSTAMTEVLDGGVGGTATGVYYYEWTPTATGHFYVIVSKAGAVFSRQIVIVEASFSGNIETALDNYPNKDDFKCDTTNLFTTQQMENFTRANRLHFDVQDLMWSPTNRSTTEVGGVKLANENVGSYRLITLNETRQLKEMAATVGVMQDANGTGVVTPGTLHDTTFKIVVRTDIGTGSYADRATGGTVIWESSEMSVVSGTFFERSLVRNADGASSPPYDYNYLTSYRHVVDVDPDIEILAGNYLIGVINTDSNALFMPEIHSDGITSGIIYWWKEANRLSTIDNYWGNYYAPYVQMCTYSTSNSVLHDIDEQTTEPIDANVVQVQGTNVTDIDDFKDSADVTAIKLRVDNMPQS